MTENELNIVSDLELREADDDEDLEGVGNQEALKNPRTSVKVLRMIWKQSYRINLCLF